MMDHTPEPLEPCDRPDHARVHAVMIELLNEQVRELRGRVRAQTEEILDLRRMIRVRDDMLLFRTQEVERLRSVRPSGWIARLLRAARGTST